MTITNFEIDCALDLLIALYFRPYFLTRFLNSFCRNLRFNSVVTPNILFNILPGSRYLSPFTLRSYMYLASAINELYISHLVLIYVFFTSLRYLLLNIYIYHL